MGGIAVFLAELRSPAAHLGIAALGEFADPGRYPAVAALQIAAGEDLSAGDATPFDSLAG
jgi:hypothetical protein